MADFPITFGAVDLCVITDSVVQSVQGGAPYAELPEHLAGVNAWATGAAAGTYPIGTLVYRVSTHRVYTRLVAHSAVETTPPENAPAVWKDYMPTNRWGAFDQYAYTKIQAQEQLKIVLRPKGLLDSVTLLGVLAATASITVTDSLGAPVAQLSRRMDSEGRNNWQTFFLAPVRRSTSAYLEWGTLVADPVVTVELTNPGGWAYLGNLLAGRFFGVGTTEYDTDIGLISYSRFDPEVDGTVKLTRRPGAGDISVRVFVEPQDSEQVVLLMEAYDGKPTLWIASRSDDPASRPLRKYGVLEARLTYNDHGQSTLAGRVQGMV